MCNEFYRSLGYKGTWEWCEMNPGQDPIEFWLKTVFPEKVYKKSKMLVMKKDRMPAICTWGFKHPTLNTFVNNARSDKLKTPMWAGAFKHNRCIIPVTTFFEWGTQYKYRVDPVNAPLFGIAGLFNSEDECTMLTCEPNQQIAPLHDRMPIILHKKDFDQWMIEGGPELLMPYSEELKVTTVAERKAEKPPKPKKAKPPPEHEQGSLFA